MIFLVNLWSTETEKVLLAMKCFGLLYEESCLLASDRPSPIHPFPLASAYHKFGNDVLQTGNIHIVEIYILMDGYNFWSSNCWHYIWYFVFLRLHPFKLLQYCNQENLCSCVQSKIMFIWVPSAIWTHSGYVEKNRWNWNDFHGLFLSICHKLLLL